MFLKKIQKIHAKSSADEEDINKLVHVFKVCRDDLNQERFDLESTNTKLQ